MNTLLIVVIAIFLICAVVGYFKGFIKIVASLATAILTIVLVSALTPAASGLILKTFPLEQSIQEKCDEVIADALGAGMNPEEIEESREAQIALIENSQLPESILDLLLANNNSEIYESLGVNTFADYLGSYLAKLIANIIAFIVLAIIVSIVLRIVFGVLGLVGKLPVIGGINKMAGGVMGLVIGLICVWALFLVITLTYDTEFGREAFADVVANPFLKSLYDNNILMNYLTNFGK